MKTLAWHYFVSWANPYTEPPDAQPRRLTETVLPPRDGGGCPPLPPEIQQAWQEANAAFVATLPDGSTPIHPWCISVGVETTEPRRLSEAAKHRIRRRRLEKRVLKRYPLFAEAFFREELTRKPEYFGLTTDQALGWRMGADDQKGKA